MPNREKRFLTPFPFPQAVLVLAGAIWAVGFWAGVAHAQMSIPDFVTAMKESPTRLTNRELHLEGRVASFAKDMIRFTRCDVPFRPQGPLTAPKSRNLEVRGQLQKDARGRWFFVVRDITTAPTDLETFQSRITQARNKTPTDWYALGDWARERGEFYKDAELQDRGIEAYQKGLDAERSALKPTDTRGPLLLAARADELGLPKSLAQCLVHQSFAARWKASQNETDAGRLDALATELRQKLRGSVAPLKQVDSELAARYSAQPVEVYDAGDETLRRQLERLMYVDVRFRALTQSVSADGRNALQVADLLEAELPERRATATEVRERDLASRAAEVEALTRAQLLALAQEFVNRRQPDEADRLKERWLAVRRRRLQPDDLEGLLSLSDDYRNLLPQQARFADRLLIEAHERRPDAAEVQQRLEKLGYRRRDGAWLSPQEFGRRPEGQLERSIREGRVEIGMSGAQVRQSLGEPVTCARSIVAGQLDELWSYEQGTSNRLVVRLQRRRNQPDSTVVAVDIAK